jgi:putative hemolysin
MLIRDIGAAAARGASLLAFPGRRIVRDLSGLPETLGRVGSLELKIAVTKKEIRAIQKMRYRVFFDEGGAVADAFSRARKRDVCPFDRICDHIIVVDHDFLTRPGRRKPHVVGAYRVLRQESVRAPGTFYSASEFDVAHLVARHPGKRFLELGRSCVLPEYRARRVLELLWRGLWRYVRHHRVDVMFGCASLPGADAHVHRDALAFLRAQAEAAPEWSAPALGGPCLTEGLASASAAGAKRRGVLALPPLIKGYLRAGAFFGPDVFVDRAFNTTDVLVVLPVERIESRYIEHFGGAALEAAA